MRERLTFANVMSCVAVFLALGGSALALNANSVGSRAVKNESLKGRDVKNESLKGIDLESNAIGSREIDEAAFDLEPFVKMESTAFACDPQSSNVRAVRLRAARSERTEPGSPHRRRHAAAAQRVAKGECRLSAPGSVRAWPSILIGDPTPRGLDDGNGFALTATTDAAQLLSPGPNTFRILCNQTGGDVAFSTTLSVVALGGTAG